MALEDALTLAAAAMASPRSLRCLSHTAGQYHLALSVVKACNARAVRLGRALGRLPLQLHFPASKVPPEGLTEAVKLFGGLKILRCRERAGQMAGWVPTEEEMWPIESVEAFQELLQGVRRLGRGLLFGAGLRRTSNGFAPLAFEWAEGPAADPLQLAVTLEPGRLRLEMSSGGWSEWSRSWSLEEETLDVELSILLLQGTRHVLLRHDLGGQGAVEGLGQAEVLVFSLHRVVWKAEPPCWRPRELRRLERCTDVQA